MKKIVLVVLLFSTFGINQAQEWFTNLDVAGRLALVQDKMLFVVWEESFNGSIPVTVRSDAGNTVVIDMAQDNSLDSVIREYFVPVRLPESYYADFIKKAEGRGYAYINKLTDNSIKIMDVNGNIINVDSSMDVEMLQNFRELVETYALNTAFLNMELKNYSRDPSCLTAYLLGEKYIEYAIYAKKELRSDIIDLANIYLDEAERLVPTSNIENIKAVLQKIELAKIEQYLILDREGKARRQLNRIEPNDIEEINQRLYAFLQYTILKLQDDDIEAESWKSKISSLDLNKAEMIVNIHKYGNLN